MEKTKQRLKQLLQTENWSEDDKLWLRQYLNNRDLEELRAVALEQYSLDLTELKNVLDGKLSAQILDTIHQRIRLNQPTSYFRIVTLQRIAAAVIFMVLTSGLYFYLNKPTGSQLATQKLHPKKNDIAPGGNKAILTLSDGSKISLSDAANGEIAKQGGISITKTSNGQLIYSIANSQPTTHTSNLIYNTIETPKGGQYQINLPDGSKVWLNAASSLRFPASFTGNERKVELSGEAYFEVAHITLPAGSGAMPFKVTSGNQTIEVLGTHFNVSAYSDEPSIRTTLLEGSVRVSLPSPLSGEGLDRNFSKLIKPGQQSKVNETIKVFNVDTEEAVAWKNGYFMFNNENIQSIMRKISRWYNVDIEYRGNISQKALWGSVSRFKNVSEVLDLIELTGSVHFKIVPGDNSGEERRIIVMP
ncbi:MAG: FecR family protein [Daejeonella sp.]